MKQLMYLAETANAVRCIAQRNVLHLPLQRAAMAIAARCLFHPTIGQVGGESHAPVQTAHFIALFGLLEGNEEGCFGKKEEGCLFRDKMMRYGLENSCLSRRNKRWNQAKQLLTSEKAPQPFHRHSSAGGIIAQLVFSHLPHGEMSCGWMGEHESAGAGMRAHGSRFGKRYTQ